ncbi:GNAT family N-acetyltransferase [Sphingomonas sp. CROZ-RG-20F-R02-07]|uniref:GNAT family N-acetyltransferase n=1 Tax=Sphingomonas sp. CROZ-RG-20F-R02-07 TaxID=2914832 RepID=UPI001F56CA6A|nr:GNAT family N-acetyltransferase [Sphingomonas sp. CROZ-RG-20F-R02-07]
MVALKFQIGARTFARVERRLARVPLSLADVLAGVVPVLPPLDGADGYLVTSLRADLAAALNTHGLLATVRQRYRRYHVDLVDEPAWFAGLSGNVRSGLGRKTRKLRGEVRAYRTPHEVAAFHPLARAVSATTYQERLLGSGLPQDPAPLLSLAAEDRVRAWLMVVEGVPAAYLCCTADGDVLRYDHVGHDPAFSDRSPGAVLQMAALRDLFADRFTHFDFTEGEGQHKRQLASGSTDCVDLLLLRPTLANRGLLAALSGFDRAVGWAKRRAASPRLAALARRVRR